jgi:hypothetical protein
MTYKMKKYKWYPKKEYKNKYNIQHLMSEYYQLKQWVNNHNQYDCLEIR